MKKLLNYIESVLNAWSEARLAYIMRHKKNYPMSS